ncbi:MAG: SHOCT domain-containing protein, partial [Lactobacillus amylovorus]
LTEIMSVLLQQQIISEELTLIVNNEQVNINLLNRTTAALLTAAIKKWSRNDDNLDEQVEQIKKLKDLLDQGILTEEEFQAKKKQILKI